MRDGMKATNKPESENRMQGTEVWTSWPFLAL